MKDDYYKYILFGTFILFIVVGFWRVVSNNAEQTEEKSNRPPTTLDYVREINGYYRQDEYTGAQIITMAGQTCLDRRAREPVSTYFADLLTEGLVYAMNDVHQQEDDFLRSYKNFVTEKLPEIQRALDGLSPEGRRLVGRTGATSMSGQHSLFRCIHERLKTDGYLQPPAR